MENSENKMGIMPVNKLLISMSLPMMISMLVQALYNIVDSYFVAKISENALSAVSLAFPIQTLMIAILGGSSVGLGTVLSHSLGEKKFKKVTDVANHGIFITIIIYLIFVLMGFFLVKPFFASQTSDTEILTYGMDYLQLICIGSVGLCGQFLFERLLQSTGKTFYTMITQATGAIINIILDPIFIFGLCGMPKMGVMGAAVATIIGQICAFIFAFYLNHKKNTEVKINLKGFSPSPYLIGQIYKIGFPSIIMQSIGSIMVYGMNQILMSFTSTATAVFGVYFKLQSFIFMPIFGLNNGMMPIMAYNYGAKKKSRLLSAIKLGMVYAIGLMTIGFITFQLLPKQLLEIFDASEQMLSIGIPALRIISLHFLLAGFNIIALSTCQALGKAVYSMITSICRQLVVLLPAAYILSKFGDVNYIWWSFPIAEIVALIITAGFLIKTYKENIKPIQEE
ncbi:MAG: MATE family efflux transporter [Spirochaetaceae bacterium]|nr:MATE family efflux transporter [Spirochaetaceae bacterium]